MSAPGESNAYGGNSAFKSWAFAGVVIWAVVGAGFVLLGLRQVLGSVAPALTSFFIAGLLLAIFRPVTHWLKRHRVNDAIAAIGGVLSAILVIGALGALFLVPVISGAAGFLASVPNAAARLHATVQTGIAGYRNLPPNAQQTLQSASSAMAGSVVRASSSGVGVLVSGTTAIFSLGLAFFLALILMFWFLKDGPRITRTILQIIPERFREDVSVIGSSFDKSFSGYLVATAINCSIIFVLDGVGFSIIGLPNAWFIAAVGSLLGIIPYVGSILGFFIAVVIGLLAGPTLGVMTGLVTVTTDQIVYSFVGPVVAGKTVSLHPIMIIFALSIGAGLAGVLGAILSIPIAAAIRVVYIYYRDRTVVEERPVTTDPVAETP